ncbi:hypothetical protein A4X13_0g4747 [Tilletia indica]|uniref:Secreted protein n=1 Tax=Tilletia indica TaxID=43049 RepID=A0A8T8SY05_9BASI|nr:hypothetical protein A4X13_0g4747 [Tilletia indica]
MFLLPFGALLYACWLTTSMRTSAQTRAVSLRWTALSATSRILVADMLNKHILDPPHRHSRTRQSRRSASVSLAPTADQQGRPVVKLRSLLGVIHNEVTSRSSRPSPMYSTSSSFSDSEVSPSLKLGHCTASSSASSWYVLSYFG